MSVIKITNESEFSVPEFKIVVANEPDLEVWAYSDRVLFYCSGTCWQLTPKQYEKLKDFIADSMRKNK